MAVAVASPRELAGQTASEKSSLQAAVTPRNGVCRSTGLSPARSSSLIPSKLAIYESLLEELNKTHQFKQRVPARAIVRLSEVPNLLVLKTTVVKYTPGSETRRAVTTFSGATKLTRPDLNWLPAREKLLLDHTVNGNVRFFGSNLRATHNLARNIAKVIKQSDWLGSEQLARYSPVNSDCGRHTSPGF